MANYFQIRHLRWLLCIIPQVIIEYWYHQILFLYKTKLRSHTHKYTTHTHTHLQKIPRKCILFKIICMDFKKFCSEINFRSFNCKKGCNSTAVHWLPPCMPALAAELKPEPGAQPFSCGSHHLCLPGSAWAGTGKKPELESSPRTWLWDMDILAGINHWTICLPYKLIFTSIFHELFGCSFVHTCEWSPKYEFW